MLSVQPFVVDSHALAFQNPDGQPDKAGISPAKRRTWRCCAFELHNLPPTAKQAGSRSAN